MHFMIYEVICVDAVKFFSSRKEATDFMQQYKDAGRKVRLDIYFGPSNAREFVEFMNDRVPSRLCGIQYYGDKYTTNKKVTVAHSPIEVETGG
jgi:hypothetical protein